MNLNTNDVGKFVLRLALGLMVLFHGIAKLTHGVDFIVAALEAHHLPGFIAYGVYLGEILAPLMLIFGVHARIGAGLIIINMLFAFWLVHLGQIFALNDQGGWAPELQGMFLFSAVAIALFGSGRLAARPD